MDDKKVRNNVFIVIGLIILFYCFLFYSFSSSIDEISLHQSLDLQAVTDAGSVTNNSIEIKADLLYLNKSFLGNTVWRIENNHERGNPAIIIANDYNETRELNLMVYGKNTTFSNIGNYAKNESVRMWGVNSHLLLDTFANNGNTYDVVVAPNGEFNIQNLASTYTGGSAFLCIANSGRVFASEVACP